MRGPWLRPSRPAWGWRTTGWWELARYHLAEAARLGGELESFTEAARLLGAAQALRETQGLAPPSSQARQAGEEAGKALGADAFEAAWRDERALSLEDALAYVARARGERKRPSTGWESLTPTERAVVSLLAEGLTNPQIGEELFIGRSIRCSVPGLCSISRSWDGKVHTADMT